jgi:DsbC/DsbD-like thiol-disulfide interchange protein
MKYCAAIFLLLIAAAFAQLDSGRSRASKGYVTTDVAPTVSLIAGQTAQVELRFRVNPGYHVNSHTPGSDLLIPTTLEFKPLEKIKTGKVTYPAGEQFALDFSPKEKISVYTGDVVTNVSVIVAKDAPLGTYALKGELQYQACNNNSCFPPKTLPVEITVIVKK